MNIDFSKIFNDFYSDISSMLPNIITGILVIIIFIIMGKLFYTFIGKRIQKKWKDTIISNFVSEATKWSFYIFGLIIALNIVGFGGIASSLIAGAGISAIIFGFAFKDIGENFLAGIILALKRPFEIGDIIEVEGYKGTVKDLDLRVTHLRNVEGKDIYIPNSSIIKNTLVNYTKDGNYDRLRSFMGVLMYAHYLDTIYMHPVKPSDQSKIDKEKLLRKLKRGAKTNPYSKRIGSPYRK